MIGKKAPNPKKSSTKSGRVGLLTAYITNPELTNGQEKCIHYEAENFMTDDLQSQTLEMIALATTAVRSKDPIDHYILSWQEGEQPTIKQAREAVQLTMKHLGLEGHQVVWGMHADTNNVHIHIEVNRVHPETLKVVEINKGFQKNAIQQAAAIVEKVQGWKTHDKSRFKTDDFGRLIKDSKNLPKVFEKQRKLEPSGKTKDMEIKTGEKSAQRLGIENAPAIIASATSWADLHTKMQAAGMEYMRQGSGAAIKVGDTVVKASDVVDRKNNFGALQKRFGLYQPANQPEINNDPLNRTELITDDRFSTGFDEQNAQPARFDTFHNLRDMSSRNLARSQAAAQNKNTSAGLLQFNESVSRRRADRVRRGSDSPDETTAERRTAGANTEVNSSPTSRGDSRTNRQTERSGSSQSGERHISNQYNKRTESGKATIIFHQRLNNQQHGWEQYQQIKKENDLAKSAERLALQKRHEAERTALYKSQKEHREATLKAVKKGDGSVLNLTRSVLAIEQAPQKLELQERQRAERKAFLAKYKPLPMYKIWKEQPLIIAPVDALHIEPISVSRTLRALTSKVDQYNNVTYQLERKDVFRDEGRIIQILDLNSEAGIAAALAVAQQKFGNVLTLTGSPEFQANAVAVAVANNLTCRFADPALDKLREQLQAEKYLAERDAARADQAAQLEEVKKPQKVHPAPIQQIGEAVPPIPEIPADQTADEWIAAQPKPAADPYTHGAAKSKFAVVHVGPDGIILDHGRTVAKYPLQPNLAVQVGDQVTIDRTGALSLARGPERGKGIGR